MAAYVSGHQHGQDSLQQQQRAAGKKRIIQVWQIHLNVLRWVVVKSVSNAKFLFQFVRVGWILRSLAVVVTVEGSVVGGVS